MEKLTNTKDRSRKAPEILALLGFALILFDSLMTYFLGVFGFQLPVNAILVLLLMIIALESRGRALLIPIFPLVMLFMGVLSFAVGIFTIPQVGYTRFLSLGSAVSAFFIGVCCANSLKSEDRFAAVCLFIGTVYCIVCMIALLRILPSFFPLKLAMGFRDGMQVIRPEITTDQNFQIFYLLPGVLAIALPFRTKRFMLALVCFFLSFYILTQLKTRSGILVLLGTLMLCILTPLCSKQMGRIKVIALPVFLGILGLVLMPFIFDFSTGLLERFTGSYHTLYGRLYAIAYLFKHIMLPEWWIPQGNTAFLKATGNLPHSNATAFFLEGGIIGLGTWIGLFIFPIIRLLIKFFYKQLSSLQTLLLIGAVATIVTQLSLNAPLHEHIWFWGGISVGLSRQLKIRHTKGVRSQIAPNPDLHINSAI